MSPARNGIVNMMLKRLPVFYREKHANAREIFKTTGKRKSR
jgi:hypothetical protein